MGTFLFAAGTSLPSASALPAPSASAGVSAGGMSLPSPSVLPPPGVYVAGTSLPPASALPPLELPGLLRRHASSQASSARPAPELPRAEPSRNSKVMMKLADVADTGGEGHHSLVSDSDHRRKARLRI